MHPTTQAARLFALAMAFLLGLHAAPSRAGLPTHEQGRAIYNFHCYFCHGYSGDAATLAATFVTPPPRDFTGSSPAELDRTRMVESVTHGRPGTAMQGFADRLTAEEIAAVVDFVRQKFMLEGHENTRYHTEANGWSDHERYAAAYPFATGSLPLDRPAEQLTETELEGRRLFLASCVTCHDHGRVEDPGPIWGTRPLSYPRAGYSHRPEERVDTTTGPTPYAIHDRAPALPPDASDALRAGERLYQENCAFCHAADGTGRNWIGRFMEPHPRDLTNPDLHRRLSVSGLRETIQHGLVGTSMPAFGKVLGENQIAAVVCYVTVVLKSSSPSNQRENPMRDITQEQSGLCK